MIRVKEGKHELEVISPDDIRIVEPASGVTYFDDFDDEDSRNVFWADYITTGSRPEVDRKLIFPHNHQSLIKSLRTGLKK